VICLKENAVIKRKPVPLRFRWRASVPLFFVLGLFAAGQACVSPRAAEAPVRPAPEKPAPAYVFPAAEWETIADPESAGYSKEGIEAVLEYAKTVPTTGFVVVARGRVLFEYGDTVELSYLASVRKSILAMLYGNYVADGKVRLEKTLAELGITDHDGLSDQEREATIADLLGARSGIYHPASNSGDNLADAPPRGSQKHGEYFLYSNWDFNALGPIFEQETGRNIYDALETDLARPIGMQDFNREAQRKSGNLTVSMHPAYHMWLSTRDMARIGYLMLREGNWAGKQVVPRDWVRKITSPLTRREEMNPEAVRKGPFGYGYLWWVFDGPAAVGPYEGAYSGRGAGGQLITVFPKLDLVVAHKTHFQRTRRQTSWSQYQGLLDKIIAAKTVR
jgi:CubicO group peptidase (beta-lactamase class C family)